MCSTSGESGKPGLLNPFDTRINLAIIFFALVLRLVLLGLKPAHFDEGVNGWFIDQMTRQGYYHYDATNFHGPLHFYVLYIAQSLFGRAEWVLRFPLALVSTATVAMMLAYRHYLGTRVCQIAALAMAISPAFVFYGRYAIHESWLVLFLQILIWGLAGLCHFGTKRYLWAAAFGLTGAILIKETYIIHAVALALGYGTLRLIEAYSPSGVFHRATQQWTSRDLQIVVWVNVGILVLFYTGFFMDWSSLRGLIASLFAWAQTGTAGNGHEKPIWYWLELMGRYEWPALLGLAASPLVLRRYTGRFLRWLTISTCGTLVAYSIVAYKTPWCLISFAWAFYFLFAAGVLAVARWLDRWVATVAAAAVLGFSLLTCLSLNFRNYTDETEPYVYVQTNKEINLLLDPLRTLASRDSTYYHLPGYILLSEVHPLPWLLGDFTGVVFTSLSEMPDDVSHSQFFLAPEEFTEELERSITGSYFKHRLTMRGSSGAIQVLYLRTGIFGVFYPGRAPDFTGTKEAAPKKPKREIEP